MGVKRDKETLWVRCWDGTEMEYEPFVVADIKNLIALKFDNYSIASRLGMYFDTKANQALDIIRKERC